MGSNWANNLVVAVLFFSALLAAVLSFSGSSQASPSGFFSLQPQEAPGTPALTEDGSILDAAPSNPSPVGIANVSNDSFNGFSAENGSSENASNYSAAALTPADMSPLEYVVITNVNTPEQALYCSDPTYPTECQGSCWGCPGTNNHICCPIAGKRPMCFTPDDPCWLNMGCSQKFPNYNSLPGDAYACCPFGYPTYCGYNLCYPGTCPTPACNSNSNCGANGYVSYTCQGNARYGTYRTFSCTYPGQPNAVCSSSDANTFIENCPYGCSAGQCQAAQYPDLQIANSDVSLEYLA